MTESNEVYDLFLALINDHRLISLYQTSGSAVFYIYLEPWLLMAINEFSEVANQSLGYDLDTQVFTEELTAQNKIILAQIMTKYWLQKEVQDVLQMRLTLQDRDFKHYSEAQNLKEKKDLYSLKCEEIDLILNRYAYKNNDWETWNLQSF
jgi:hypothetical protein